MVKIYSVNGNESIPIGRVDDDGRVYNALEGGVCVGAVDPYGMVHIPPLEGDVVGFVDHGGKVYEDGELSPYVGRTDANGMVHDPVPDCRSHSGPGAPRRRRLFRMETFLREPAAALQQQRNHHFHDCQRSCRAYHSDSR